MLLDRCCRYEVVLVVSGPASAESNERAQPNVCVLLDVGTRPSHKSIYYLWKTFDLNSNVAGACGEIAAYKGKNWSGLLNPLGKSSSAA